MKFDRSNRKSRRELDDEFSAALAVADAASAKFAKAAARAAKARAEADRALAEAERAFGRVTRKGEELEKCIRAEKAAAEGCAPDPNTDGDGCSSRCRTRELLVKALGMLGSDQVEGRASAALLVEKQRTKLGKTWDELIIHEGSIHGSTRELLVKALGMLGSDHVGERAAAALMAEKQRAKLSKTWNELIIRERDDDDEGLDDDDVEDEDDEDDDDDDDDDADDEE
jgi:hypothetical protein